MLKLAVTALIPLLVSGLSRRFKHISVALSISTVMMAVIVAWNMLNIVLG